MAKSKVFHFSLGAAAGVALAFVSLTYSPCSNTGLIIFNVERSLLPCPALAPAPPVKATGKVPLELTLPQGATVSPGDSFQVRLEVIATNTAVNAVDVTIDYSGSLLRLVSKDESATPFAIHLGSDGSSSLSEVILVEPNPGIESVAPLATFTFQALQAGTATITIASSSQVLANDGFGTDVLGPVQDASVTIRKQGG